MTQPFTTLQLTATEAELFQPFIRQQLGEPRKGESLQSFAVCQQISVLHGPGNLLIT